MNLNDVTWRHAEAYFREHPAELVRRMFQWAKKDDRKAARNMITHWLNSQHPELKATGKVTLDAWIELFYSEKAYASAYRDWREWYVERARS